MFGQEMNNTHHYDVLSRFYDILCKDVKPVKALARRRCYCGKCGFKPINLGEFAYLLSEEKGESSLLSESCFNKELTKLVSYQRQTYKAKESNTSQ